MQSLNIKELKMLGVIDYTNQLPSKHFEQKKMSKFKTPENENLVKCAQNRSCTSSMCEQLLCKD